MLHEVVFAGLEGSDEIWPRAITGVLDRVMGRAAQRVEVSGHLTHGLNLRRLTDGVCTREWMHDRRDRGDELPSDPDG